MSTTYTNPILAGDYPDPSLLRVNGDYYMTHSSFNWAPGLLIWHSTNLIEWAPLCFALTEYDGDVWAPDLITHEGQFYIYYKTSGGNHVVVADEIAGPWSTPYDVGAGYIDPGHVVGPDGTRYIHLSAGMAVALTPDGLKAIGEPEKVYEGWPIPEEWSIEGICLEGPKLFKRGDYYYLISAEGGTAGVATSHMVVVARSKHPLGPWENSPHNPLIHTENCDDRWWSCGHGTLFDDTDGNWWCVYHAYEGAFYTLGRQTLLEPIDWEEDGWPVARPDCDRAKAIARPVGSPGCAHGMPKSDSFRADTLGLQWRFWGEFDPSRFTVGGGQLVLKARGEGPNDTSPLSIIAGDHTYEVEIDVEVTAGCEAGLMLYYNSDSFVGISINADGELRRFRHGKRPSWASKKDAPKRLRLKLINDRHSVQGYIADGDGPWQKCGGATEVSGYHHNTFGGFLSLRPALFAYGNGQARFRDFVYRSI